MSEVSKRLKLIFPEFEALIEVKKHFSPAIYLSLMLKIPMSTFAYPSRGDLLIKVDIKRGEMPKVPKLLVGDVYYNATEDAIGISLNEKEIYSRSLIKIGSVLEGLNLLANINKVTPVKIVSV